MTLFGPFDSSVFLTELGASAEPVVRLLAASCEHAVWPEAKQPKLLEVPTPSQKLVLHTTE
jgi:hypothetical protein